MFGIVYVITNRINGKNYVGQTTRTLEQRFTEHAKADTLLGKAIQMDGAENFSREVLEMCRTQEQLDEREKFWIAKLDCKFPNGYNTQSGGHRRSKSDDAKYVITRKGFLLKLIGAKIAYYRTLRDMSQSELAKRVYLSRSALSRIERGKYHDNVSVITLSDIAEALQIDITLLVTFNEMEKQMWWNPLPSELKDDEEEESEDENSVASVPAEHQKGI